MALLSLLSLPKQFEVFLLHLLTVVLLQLQYNGVAYGQTFTNFTIMKANLSSSVSLQTATLATYYNDATPTIDINSYSGPLSLVIGNIGNFKAVQFVFNGKSWTEFGAPYTLNGNNLNNYNPVPDLREPGLKNILIRGYDTDYALIRTLSISFTIVNAASPTAPLPVLIIPAPIPAPSSIPSRIPSKVPSSKPSGRPSSKPSGRPSSRPSARPITAPVSAALPTGPNTFTGTFTLVRAGMSGVTDTAVFLGNYSNGATINISSFINQDLSLAVNFRCCFMSVVFNSISLTPASFVKTEGGAPYALNGNSLSNYNVVTDLSISGPKRIIVTGHSATTPTISNTIATIVFEFNIVGGRPISPVPIPAPLHIPVPVPTTPAPVPQAPVAAELCTIPKFVTPAWENYKAKPGGNVAESQGGFIGTDFVIFGGFSGWWYSATNKTYVYNTITGNWSQVDSIPIPKGVTHMGHVIVGNKLYGCGGLLGGTGDMTATPECFVYTHGNAPGSQWSALPNLPAKRGGGALMYDKALNSLIFASGLEVHKDGVPDSKNVWQLSLANITAGWLSKVDMPYAANHVGGATVLYGADERHYVMGGQKSLGEWGDNYNSVYEYNASSDTWTQRANMKKETGHIGSSTIPYKNCGLFLMGGAQNGGKRTSDIYYYSIGGNNWTFIGSLKDGVNTPVCSTLDDWIYCQSGIFGTLSYRRKIG